MIVIDGASLLIGLLFVGMIFVIVELSSYIDKCPNYSDDKTIKVSGKCYGDNCKQKCTCVYYKAHLEDE